MRAGEARLSSDHTEAAVDLDDLSRQIRGAIRCEEEHGFGHILRSPLPPERSPLNRRLASLWRAEHIVEARADEARRYAIHADPQRADLLRQRPDIGRDGTLGRRIMGGTGT